MNSDSISIANRMLPESVDMLILLGAIALVALVVFVCVLIFRKDETRRHKSHRQRHRKNYREQLKNTGSGIKEIIHRNRRQRQREHRAINPTLAQTGGLPPIREDDKSPPSSPPP